MVRSVLAAAFQSLAGPAAGIELSALDLAALGPAAQPNLAVDGERGFVLSWQVRDAEGCSALQVATLSLDGDLGPVREVARGCDWFVNWADFPSLVVADNGDWVSFWLQKNGSGTYHYEIRTTRSTDRGRSWSPPLVPHRDGTASEHGFVAMAATGGDRVALIWLDGRQTAQTDATGHAGHDDHQGHHGRMQLRSTQLGRAGHSADDQLIDDDVCSCCWTDLVRLPRGDLLAAYRDRSVKEIRDIRLASFNGQRWQADGLLHQDGWKIAACPTNGPALARLDDEVLAVWPTMVDSQRMAVRALRVGSEQPPVEIESHAGTLGRPDVVALKDHWLLSWLGAGADAGGGNGSVLRLLRLDRELVERERRDVVTLPAGRSIGVPRMASAGSVAALVWTEPVSTEAATQARPETRLAGRLIRRPEQESP